MRRILCVLAVAAVLLAACGDDSSGGGGTVYSQSGEQISTKAGEQFTIELAANPSTGYSWSLAASPGDQVSLVDSDYEPEGKVQPGSAGVQRFVFEATTGGATTLSFSYARPWETGVAPVQAAEFPLSVA